MVNDLGATTLEVSVEGHADSKFNCKVVFHDLEPLLRQKGHRLLSCETRQNGRYTPMSVRARTHAGVQLSRQKLKAKLRIIEHKDAHYTAKLVFVGLEEALAQQGIVLEWIETREGGQGTPIAARVNIT